MFCAMMVSACADCVPAGSASRVAFIAARTSGGRSVEVRTMSSSTLSKKEGSICQESFERSVSISLLTMGLPGPAIPRELPDRTRSARRAAGSRRRVLRQPDGARGRELPHQRPAGARRPRHGHHPRQEGRGRSQPARSAGSSRTWRGRSSRRPTRSSPAGCAISSSSTSTRPAPARRTT